MKVSRAYLGKKTTHSYTKAIQTKQIHAIQYYLVPDRASKMKLATMTDLDQHVQQLRVFLEYIMESSGLLVCLSYDHTEQMLKLI